MFCNVPLPALNFVLSRGVRRLLPVVLAVMLGLGFGARGFAATLTVTNLDDSGSGSLRQAITDANAGDTINFSPTVTGTITLASPLTIVRNLTIQGPGAGSVTISGNNSVQVFNVSGGTVSLSGLTIANANGGGVSVNSGTMTVDRSVFTGNTAFVGGAIFNQGVLTVTNSAFVGNSAPTGAGGAIYNYTGGTTTIANSTFFGNTGASPGGAVINLATMTITNSTFSGNSGALGGAIYSYVYPTAVLTVSNSILSNNSPVDCAGKGCPTDGTNGNIVGETAAQVSLLSVGNYGGPTPTMLPTPTSTAICMGSASAAVAAGLTTDQRGWPLSASNCANGGVDAGAVQTNYLLVNNMTDANDGSCTTSACSLRDAITQANTNVMADVGFASTVPGTITLGSALPNATGTLNLIGPGANSVTVSGGNSSTVGTMLTVNLGANVVLYGLTFTDATSSSYGGAVYSLGTLMAMNDVFSGNSSAYGGGISNSGALTVTGSTFTGNSASFGGGIYTGGPATVSDSTFSANTSMYQGGGIAATGSLVATSNTFSGNTSAYGGGIAANSTATVTNSVFVGNSASSWGGGIDDFGSLVNASYNVYWQNLENNGAQEGDCNYCLSDNNAVSGNPQLEALGNYGGSTTTMLPLPGSAAICAGSTALVPALLTTDQRGFARLNTSYGSSACVDAGAVQTNYQSIAFASTSYSGVVNQAVSPAPVVVVTESGQNIGAVPVTLGFSGVSPVTATGLSATTVAGVGATFGTLVVNTVGDYTLSATLQITPTIAISANPATLDITYPAPTVTNVLPNSGPAVGGTSVTVTGTNFTGATSVTFGGVSATSFTVVSATAITAVSPASAAGTVDVVVTASGGSSATSAADQFTYTSVGQTITGFAPPSTGTYGEVIALSATGGASGNPVTFSVTSGPGSISGNQLTLTGVGSVVVTASQAGNAQYAAATPVQKTIGVTAAPLSVVVNSATRAYGVANPVFSGTASGFVNGDTAASVGLVYSSAATVNSAPGAYAITASLTNATAAQDYSLNVSAGTLTITTAANTITFAQPNAVTYGTSPVTLSASASSGLPVAFAVSSGPATLNGSVLTITGGGTVVVTASQAGNADYAAATPVSRTITVNPAVPGLTLTPSAASAAYGTTIVLTAQATGVSGGVLPTGTVTLVLDGTAHSLTLANGVATYSASGLAAGQHTATASYGGDANYQALNGVNASFAITQGTLNVSANSTTKVYGTANPAFTGSVTGQLNGDSFTESFSTAATTLSNVGTYAIVPSVSGANLADYTVKVTNGSLAITQAGSSLALSASASTVSPGQSLTLSAVVTSATTGVPTGTVQFYNGATPLGTASLNGGTANFTLSSFTAGSSLTLTAVYGGDTNFFGSSSSSVSTVTVSVLDFSFGVSGTGSQVTTPGGAVSYTLQVAPIGGVYPGSVNFAVNGLPGNTTVSFSPATIAANGGAQTVTLNVQTMSYTASGKDGSSGPGRSSGSLMLALLLLPMAGARRLRRSGEKLGRCLAVMLLAAAALAATAGLSGCGSGVKDFTYPVTITATSGPVQHSVAVSLEVK